jgi:hypothetical protein
VRIIEVFHIYFISVLNFSVRKVGDEINIEKLICGKLGNPIDFVSKIVFPIF